MNVGKQINHLYVTKNKDELVKVKESLSATIKEYDVFFDEYLEVFDDKMNASTTQDSPEWKAYRDKYTAYENIKKNIKLANYYLGMI